jgi:phosphatidylethanolamine/phosphatidyl-N-methylethanolamine N-methyltransferase
MSLLAVADHVRFFQLFLRAPRTVGAIAPSSSVLAAEIVRQAGVSDARTIVELGGGTGAFTERITREAPEDAVILSIEVNPTFAEILASRFADVHVVADSAERVSEHLRSAGRVFADCVVSGLPWAAFDGALQSRLLAAIRDVLAIGGTFATFAYVHASWLPTARHFRERLESNFASVHVTPVVWRNLPPAFVYRCTR